MTTTPELWFALGILVGAYHGRGFRLFTTEGMCTYIPVAPEA